MIRTREFGGDRKTGRAAWLSRSLPLALLVLFAAPLLLVPVAPARASGGPIIPGGVLYYVPITLTNGQASATPADFQQQLTVDWGSYTAHLDAGVQNVEFFDNGGTVLKGWCESSCSSTAASSTVWVNLGPDTIAAGGGTLTVYMGFLSTGTNNMGSSASSVWGEAPQLSATYGQFDDGANVFSFYDNFAGTTLSSKWTTYGATIIVNNGVRISGGSSTFDLTTASYTASPPFEMEAYGTLPVAGYSWAVGAGDRAGLNGIGASGFNGQSSPAKIQGGQSTPTVQTRAGNYGTVATTGIWTTEAISMTTSNFYFDYGNKNTVSVDAPAYPVYFNLAGFVGNPSPALSYSWARVRAYPPGGVMPSVSFGPGVAVTTTTVVCSPSTTIDAGTSTSCTASVAGQVGSITGETVSWTQSAGTASVSFSASTCPLSSAGACSVTVTGEAPGSVTILASYPGDSSNSPGSGIFLLSIVTPAAPPLPPVIPSSLTFGFNFQGSSHLAGSYVSLYGGGILYNIPGYNATQDQFPYVLSFCSEPGTGLIRIAGFGMAGPGNNSTEILVSDWNSVLTSSQGWPTEPACPA